MKNTGGKNILMQSIIDKIENHRKEKQVEYFKYIKKAAQGGLIKVNEVLEDVINEMAETAEARFSVDF